MSLMSFACVCLAAFGVHAAAAREPILVVRSVPESGLVMARVDLTSYVPAGSVSVQARDEGGAAVPCQFVPSGERERRRGTLVLSLKPGGERRIRLYPTVSKEPVPAAAPETIAMGGASVTFGDGPFPVRFAFTKTGKVFDRFDFNDRLHDPKTGGFSLRLDKQARPEVISEGELCTVVRVHARYVNAAGEAPPSKPTATYEWFVFHDRPLIYLSADARQDTAFAWSEQHFVELNFPGADFGSWAGGDPERSGEFTGSKKTETFWVWGALVDGPNALGLIGETARFYDGRGEYGTYIHGPWDGWAGTERHFSTWMWVGSADDVKSVLAKAAPTLKLQASAFVTDSAAHSRIAAARASAAKLTGSGALPARWRAGLAERMEVAGKPDAALAILDGKLPAGWSLHRAGELGLAFEQRADGIRLTSLCDTRQGRDMAPANPAPLFSLKLKELATGGDVTLRADAGWEKATVTAGRSDVSLRWTAPARFGGMQVLATAKLEAARNAAVWTFRVEGGKGWSVMRADFPQVTLAEPGANAAVLYPCGPGQEQRGVWHKPFSYRSMYPCGWASMQFLAGYATGGTGLYIACHDAYGGTKEVVAESDPASATVSLRFEQPAADSGREANGFELSGTGVWRLLRGDWFDAATMYRDWVRREAKWWPKLGKDGREDTPLWMRELCAWAQTGGNPAECVEPVKAMQKALGIPIGFHWYNWHQIPFDNDYPHYFPTKPGVADGVADLQRNGVHVMPYINGRLWDTHDRGTEDFEFTKVALPAVTKQPDGKPFTEQYGSKESDGSPVTLGVMCPTTPIWQKTVREVVLRIMNEVGTHAVYIDQIAAASPVLCADSTHGHPLGGGHWWTKDGYWPLLAALRAAMPKDRMITTECNGEPYIRYFDGYLTWHWQNEGMVPAFPAIYGGAIQMFGRSYGGGSTRTLATRMKAAQQLVYGEQIGWFDPHMVSDPEFGAFVRGTIAMRHALRRYFYVGEMARVPKVTGEVPTVRADWQWGGEAWVTTDAVLRGAWVLPGERRLVAIFANVSDKPVQLKWKADPRSFGIAAAKVTVRAVEPSGGEGKPIAGAVVDLNLGAATMEAYELRS